MAVTLDIGQRDHVHPPDKQTVGARLALSGRALAHGESTLEWSGPLYRQVTREGANLWVWFDHAEGLHSIGETLQGFEVADGDGHFIPANAVVHGSAVVVSSPAISLPTGALRVGEFYRRESLQWRQVAGRYLCWTGPLTLLRWSALSQGKQRLGSTSSGRIQ